MKVALDNQVGEGAIRALKAAGHEVVMTAGDLPDHVWHRRAVEAGAELFFSPDYDIENLSLDIGKSFVRIPQGLGRGELNDWVVRAANAAQKVKSTYKEFPGMLIFR